MQNEPIWKVLSKEMLVDSPWLGVEAQTCELPNGKVISPFYVVRQPDWVLVLAQNTDGNWILGRQYRHGMGRWFLEFTAGIIDPGESPMHAAQRELTEETGYSGGEWNAMGTYPVNPDRQGARFFLFLATGVQKTAETSFDDSEDIRLQLMSGAELDHAVDNGQLEHPHHVLAWLLLKRK